MKILRLTPTLFIKNSPFNHLIKDIMQGLVDAGNEIIHIVATDSLDNEDYNLGIPGVKYVPVVRKSVEKSNIIKRYTSDVAVARKMSKLIKKYDADVLFEDVTYVSPIVVKEAKRHGLKVVSMFQDVWPDNTISAGLLTESSPIYKSFDMLQKPVYNLSDRYICISADMKNHIAPKIKNTDKMNVIYNWGYDDEPVDISWQDNKFVEKYGLSSDLFYVVYAGNIGRMQNVESIVETAKLLQDRKDIKFLIVGEGVMRDKIVEESAGLTNVDVLPYQDPSIAKDVYSSAGINIIPLKADGIKTALPSKIGVCLSCGNPIALCVSPDTEIAKDIIRNGSGAVVPPDDYEALAKTITSYADEFARTHKVEKRHDLFLKNFTRSKNVEKYVEVITGE